MLLTADTVLETRGGTPTVKDAVALGTTGKRNYVDLATIVAGSDRWAGATGDFRISGRFAATTEDGSATYAGKACTS